MDSRLHTQSANDDRTENKNISTMSFEEKPRKTPDATAKSFFTAHPHPNTSIREAFKKKKSVDIFHTGEVIPKSTLF